MAKTMEENIVKTKTLRNASGYRMELYLNGKLVVLLPGKSVKVSAETEVPMMKGLIVK